MTGTSNSPTPNLSVLYSNSSDRGTRGPLPSAEPPSMPKITSSKPTIPSTGYTQATLNRKHLLDKTSKTAAPNIDSNTISHLRSHDPTFQQAGMHDSTSFMDASTSMPRHTTSNQIPDSAETTMMHRGKGLSGNHTPFAASLPLGSTSHYNPPFDQPNFVPNAYDYAQGQPAEGHMSMMNTMGSGFGDATLMDSPYHNMTIESHDIDPNALGEEMMLWLDRLPPDAHYLFDPQNPNMPDYRDVG